MARTTRQSSGVAEWMEPIPLWAGPEWCLPAIGGRVLIRGYDTYRSTLTDLDDGWGLDETLVPLTDATAAKTDGPAGELHPGDCVVFIGTAEDSVKPLVWRPQRVVHVAAGPRGWQRVWAIRPPEPLQPTSDVIRPQAIAKRLRVAGALHGTDRKAILELFGLNLECPSCGSHGWPVHREYIIDATFPAGKIPVGWTGIVYEPVRGEYECPCGATWTVTGDGSMTVTEPLPTI